MQKKTLSAGDFVESRCTKCREVTGHTIIAMTGEVPAKVECNSCGGQHKFRPVKPPAPAKKAAPGRKTVSSKAAEKNEWQTLAEQMDPAKATVYSMTESFKPKALISHPVFGLGVVQRIAGSQKIEVLFEDGKKILRCK